MKRFFFQIQEYSRKSKTATNYVARSLYKIVIASVLCHRERYRRAFLHDEPTGLSSTLCFCAMRSSFMSALSDALFITFLISLLSCASRRVISWWCWFRVPSHSSSQSRVMRRNSVTSSLTSDIILQHIQMQLIEILLGIICRHWSLYLPQIDLSLQWFLKQVKPGVHTRDYACLRPDWTVASKSGRDSSAFIAPTEPRTLSRHDTDLATLSQGSHRCLLSVIYKNRGAIWCLDTHQ